MAGLECFVRSPLRSSSAERGQSIEIQFKLAELWRLSSDTRANSVLYINEKTSF